MMQKGTSGTDDALLMNVKYACMHGCVRVCVFACSCVFACVCVHIDVYVRACYAHCSCGYRQVTTANNV